MAGEARGKDAVLDVAEEEEKEVSANSKIEWTTHTFNPWEGCTKVSPGCSNCYAEARNKRFSAGKNWGKGAPRQRRSEAYWQQPLKWNFDARPSLVAHRPRVFCASLADWLDDEVPIEWLADLLKLIHDTPNLDWLALSKRPENWRTRLNEWASSRGAQWTRTESEIAKWMEGEAPRNVWIGTTVEDQQRADERIPALLTIPARVRFLSCEPLLEPVSLPTFYSSDGTSGFVPGISWVICGGESGHGARPMHPDWARSLRDQCQAAGAAFFMKQMGGSRKPFPSIPPDLQILEFPT